METDLTVQNQNAISMDGDMSFIVDLTAPRQTTFCSMIPKTDEEKANLYNAMNNPEKRVADCINIVLEIKDLFVEVVQCANTETGEVKHCPRIVLIDNNGVGYQCVSIGIYSALKKLMTVYGIPTWEKPIPLKVTQITKGVNKLLTLNIDQTESKSKTVSKK